MRVGNLKIALPENIVLMLHPHVDLPVEFVRYVTRLWMANCVYVVKKMLHLYNFAIKVCFYCVMCALIRQMQTRWIYKRNVQRCIKHKLDRNFVLTSASSFFSSDQYNIVDLTATLPTVSFTLGCVIYVADKWF